MKKLRTPCQEERDLHFNPWLPDCLPVFPHCRLVSLQESASKCFYGDRCRFLHDVSLYLETKPADLGPRCVLFETFGRCPYGVTCRFAGAHLGPEGQNLVQEGLVQAPNIRNGLDKALQQQLRKRKVCFERSEQALRQLSKGRLPGPTPTAAEPEVTEADGAPEQDGCDAQQASHGPQQAPPSGPLRTCGPLTDEDVVRLRPCEKRRVCVTGSPLRTWAVLGTDRAGHSLRTLEGQGCGRGEQWERLPGGEDIGASVMMVG